MGEQDARHRTAAVPDEIDAPQGRAALLALLKPCNRFRDVVLPARTEADPPDLAMAARLIRRAGATLDLRIVGQLPLHQRKQVVIALTCFLVRKLSTHLMPCAHEEQRRHVIHVSDLLGRGKARRLPATSHQCHIAHFDSIVRRA